MSTIYDKLNDKQKQAVFTTEGPLLLLAGAGSGKTGVLMHRIAYLIEEKHVDPYNIMAITFTNKAAKEMKERIGKLIGEEGNFVWVMTFHSSCVRFLRRFIDKIGFDNSFTIYDSDDQKTLMKKIFKENDINTKVYKERAVLNIISSCKNELMSPAEFMKSAIDSYEKGVARLYEIYQSALKKNNALDFDDLICRSVELFEKCPEVLDYYQDRMKIEELDFTVRSYNCLKKAGVNTISDLTSMSYIELLKIKNLGRKSLNEIIDKMKELGYDLSEEAGN